MDIINFTSDKIRLGQFPVSLGIVNVNSYVSSGFAARFNNDEFEYLNPKLRCPADLGDFCYSLSQAICSCDTVEAIALLNTWCVANDIDLVAGLEEVVK